MKKFIVLFLFFISVVSCQKEDYDVTAGRRIYKKYLKSILKDPSSLEIYNEEYKKVDGGVEWYVDFGAKNGYGGNVRERAVFWTDWKALTIKYNGKDVSLDFYE